MMKSRERGYTLTEALVVIGIIGLITVVTTPAMVSMYQSSRLKTSLRNFSGDIRWARQLAVTQQRYVKLEFSTGTAAQSYKIYEADAGSDYPGTYSTAAVRTTNLEKSTYIDATNCVGQDGPGNSDPTPDIVFGPMGTEAGMMKAYLTDNSSVQQQWVRLASKFTVNPNTYTIYINPSGSLTTK
jgi:Tfp pilus assembly protein FimT